MRFGYGDGLLEKRFVDQFAFNSGIGRDKAERDIVLTYALKVLHENKALPLLAFKGGTCLRKTLFGRTGRFSMDLDFTSTRGDAEAVQALFRRIFHGRNHYGLVFRIREEVRQRMGDVLSYLCELRYEHSWGGDTLLLQVSMREKPVLELLDVDLLDESYWRHLEFPRFRVPCLRSEELLAEKIRASVERTSSRDLFDLYLFASQPYRREIARALVVEKLWNARVVFDPEELRRKIREGRYDWEDLESLVPAKQLPKNKAVIARVIKEYAYLGELNATLRKIIADSRKHALSSEVRDLRLQLRREAGS